jgi:hypothetical protein
MIVIPSVGNFEMKRAKVIEGNPIKMVTDMGYLAQILFTPFHPKRFGQFSPAKF